MGFLAAAGLTLGAPSDGLDAEEEAATIRGMVEGGEGSREGETILISCLFGRTLARRHSRFASLKDSGGLLENRG